MAERAKISRHYHLRLFIIGLGALLAGLWFLYDGYVAYPQKQVIYQAFMQIQEDHPTDGNIRWLERASAEGWPDEPMPIEDHDIWLQRIIAYALIPVGGLILFSFLLNLRRWVALDETGLTDHAGRHVKLDQITEFDKSRWHNKGIAVVKYEADGRSGRMVLDDWKFERQPIDNMVAAIDKALGNEAEPAPDPDVVTDA